MKKPPLSESFTDIDGDAYGPLSPGWIVVPDRVSLVDHSIGWEYEPTHAIRPPPDLLWTFLRLKREEDFLEFARRFGVLTLSRSCFPAVFGSEAINPLPVWRWREWVTYFETVLRLALEIREGRKGSPENWAKLGKLPNPVRYGYMRTLTLDASHQLLSVEFNKLLELGNVRFTVAWKPDGSLIGMRFPFNLFSVLVYQLFSVASRSHGLMWCHGCHGPYIREAGRRRPNPGTRTYCLECSQSDKDKRDAERRYRAGKQA